MFGSQRFAIFPTRKKAVFSQPHNAFLSTTFQMKQRSYWLPGNCVGNRVRDRVVSRSAPGRVWVGPRSGPGPGRAQAESGSGSVAPARLRRGWWLAGGRPTDWLAGWLVAG